MFRSKTVSSVVASFQKTVDDLNKIAASKAQDAEDADVIIEATTKYKEDALKEGERAIKIAMKINGMIEV